MRSAFLALFLVLLGLSPLTLAADAPTAPATCRCLWQGPFVEAQADADRVIRASVTARAGNAIDLAVITVLRGELYAREIRLWADYDGAPADSCRAPAAPFEPGSEWILALQQIHEIPRGFSAGDSAGSATASYGRPGDYFLSACGATWLEVRDDFARGNVANPTRWLYEDEEMEPVDAALLQQWLAGELAAEAVIEAARPNPEARRLRQETLRFLRDQLPPPYETTE